MVRTFSQPLITFFLIISNITVVLAAALLAQSRPTTKQPAKARNTQAAIREVLHSICDKRTAAHSNTILLGALRLTTAKGGEVTMVQPLRCGFGADARARLNRREALPVLTSLAKLYGVKLQVEQEVLVDDARIKLPVADLEKKVAFAVHTTETNTPEAGLLDAGVVAKLRQHGWSVHYVDLEDFRAAQTDRLSPMLAYAVSAVAFLEREAGNVGFDTSLFLGEVTELRYAANALVLRGATNLIHDDKSVFFVVSNKATLRLQMQGIPAVKGQRSTLVVFGSYWTPHYRDGGYDFSGPRPSYTLVQGRLRVRSAHGVFLMPREFAPGKPFEIHGDLPPGQYTLAPTLKARPGRARQGR